MELILEDFLKTQQKVLDKIVSLESGQKALQNRLDDEIRKRLKYANTNRFGDKRQKVKKDSNS